MPWKFKYYLKRIQKENPSEDGFTLHIDNCPKKEEEEMDAADFSMIKHSNIAQRMSTRGRRERMR